MSSHNMVTTTVWGFINARITLVRLGVSMLLLTTIYYLGVRVRTLGYVPPAYQVKMWGPARKE